MAAGQSRRSAAGEGVPRLLADPSRDVRLTRSRSRPRLPEMACVRPHQASRTPRPDACSRTDRARRQAFLRRHRSPYPSSAWRDRAGGHVPATPDGSERSVGGSPSLFTAPTSTPGTRAIRRSNPATGRSGFRTSSSRSTAVVLLSLRPDLVQDTDDPFPFRIPHLVPWSVSP